MDLLLIMNACVLICSLIGFIYGVKRFFKRKQPVILQIITCAVACLMYARLFHVVFILVQGEMNLGLDIGMLGLAGSLLFILSANYGQLDSLVDDGSRKFLPTRIIALIAPIIVIGLYVLIFILVDMLTVRVELGIVTFFMVPCVYYNLKHVIIFDIDMGIIRSMRPYNMIALLYSVSIMVEFYAEFMDIVPLYIGTMIVQGIIALTIVPVAKKGVMKWTI